MTAHCKVRAFFFWMLFAVDIVMNASFAYSSVS